MTFKRTLKNRNIPVFLILLLLSLIINWHDNGTSDFLSAMIMKRTFSNARGVVVGTLHRAYSLLQHLVQQHRRGRVIIRASAVRSPRLRAFEIL